MKIIYAVLLIVLLAVSFIRPQWKTTVEENNIICNAPSIQKYVTMTSERKVGAFISWTKFLNSNQNN